MGRPKTIDREKVLACAEYIVAREGSAALTIDEVAKAAGITKGGVQSCFGTKEAMIIALLDRWNADYAARLQLLLPESPSDRDRLLAHIRVTQTEGAATASRAAGLVIALMQKPDERRWLRGWYDKQLEPIKGLDSKSKSRARAALFAAEGAFILRYLGIVDISSNEWDSLFDELRKLLR